MSTCQRFYPFDKVKFYGMKGAWSPPHGAAGVVLKVAYDANTNEYTYLCDFGDFFIPFVEKFQSDKNFWYCDNELVKAD